MNGRFQHPGFPAPTPIQRLPACYFNALRRRHRRPSSDVFWVRIRTQQLLHFRSNGWNRRPPDLQPVRQPYRASTSRFGIGQVENSNCTPLGLHQIARKIGAFHPPGTVFKGRRPIGLTWLGLPDATITDRILWLEGLEPGWNRGGNVDSFSRYIYIHGTGDELTLGKPATCGCVHLAAADLIPLFDQVEVGTQVWISEW
ncbi:MAG TPA: hypothetical protein DCY13_16325 [Verrucomicrobiales bacterium]|nr:hypothetical protein [Verrucomicrobiales bacterium]